MCIDGLRLRLHLSAILARKGWQQKRLALEAGMPDSTISQYTSGKRRPNIERLVKLADALDISTDELLDRGDTGELLSIWRILTPEQQFRLLEMAKSMKE